MFGKKQKGNIADVYKLADELKELCKRYDYGSELKEIDDALYGSTSGEILALLGAAVSKIVQNSSAYEKEFVSKAKEELALIDSFC